jgi:hypothetical protein
MRARPPPARRTSDIGEAAAAAAALSADDKSTTAQMVRGVALQHRDWLRLNERRHRHAPGLGRLLRGLRPHALPGPRRPRPSRTTTSPDQARRTIVVNNKKVPVIDQLFWGRLRGVAYLPATAAPIGQSSEGLPIGVQIVGPQYGDYSTIAFAKLLEQEYRSFEPPPAYVEPRNDMAAKIDLKNHIRSIPDFPQARDPVLRHLHPARACPGLARDDRAAGRACQALQARRAGGHRIAWLPAGGAARARRWAPAS